MNFLEAIKTGKRIRRSKDYMFSNWDKHIIRLNLESILAEDWEVESDSIDVTIFYDFFNKCISVFGDAPKEITLNKALYERLEHSINMRYISGCSSPRHIVFNHGNYEIKFRKDA